MPTDARGSGLPTAPDAGRWALYYEFAEPKTFEWVPADCYYDDALFRPDARGRRASRAATGSAKMDRH